MTPNRLSFAHYADNGTIDYWPSQPIEGTSTAAQGKMRADELVAAMRNAGDPIELPHIVEAIVRRGEFGMLERAFFHRLAEAQIS